MGKDRKILGFGNVFFTRLVTFFMDVSSEMIYPFVPLFLVKTPGAKSHLDAVQVLLPHYGADRGNSEDVPRRNHPADFESTAFVVYTTAVGLTLFPASFIAGWLRDHISSAETFYFGAFTASESAVLFIIFIIAIREYGPKR